MIGVRTSTTRDRFSRRSFLRKVGASAALIPLLETERAHGATAAGFPKRIVTIAWGNGVAQPMFYPPGDDPTAGPIMQPLAPLKSKVTLVAGLDIKVMLDAGHTYDGHFSFPSLFTGTYKNLGGQSSGATGPSIDQAVADEVAKTVNLPRPVLAISVQGAAASYAATGTRNTGETQVARLFSTLFAGRTMTPGTVSALTQRRKSVIDYITGELSTYGARLGVDDRARVATHLDSIRQLEKELSATSTVMCSPMDPGGPTEYQASTKAFNDIVVMALRCDVTRAVSISWAGDGGQPPNSMPFLNVGDVHGVAHQGSAGYATKVKIDTWYIQQLAYLATALDGTMEGNGTLLDNSLIVMGNDMTEGSFHSVSAIPFVLVGSAGGVLKAGRTVKVGSWATKTGNYWSGATTGIPHNRLLASIANLMDVPTMGFGAAMYPGTLTELA
jgi:Protein of unknown function (DUF1552)